MVVPTGRFRFERFNRRITDDAPYRRTGFRITVTLPWKKRWGEVRDNEVNGRGIGRTS
jgi:hypothetical protein